jgi:ABC-type branched-subunit amino acid transport system substrate-binding protein
MSLITKLLIWVTIVGVGIACTQAKLETAPPTLKIAIVAPFEGLHRPLGYEALFGVKLALQERNQAGGIQGHQVELVALNDFDEPEEAVGQAKAAIADPDVLGVVGHLSAATTAAALPVYQEANLAVVIPWSTDAPQEAHRGAVMVAANLAEAATYLDTYRQKNGWPNQVELQGPDFSAITAETQVITLAADSVTAAEILLALQQTNLVKPVLGQVDVGSPQTAQVAKSAANGLVYVSPGPDPQQMAHLASFVKAYQTLAGFTPGPRAVLAYDAAQTLFDGIEQSLSINKQATRAEISGLINQVQRHGLTGGIAFDSLGRRLEAPLWLYQVVNQTYPGRQLAP